MEWPDARALVRLRLREAIKVARQLGHYLGEWLNKNDVWSSKCKFCGDEIRVEQVGLGPEIVGPAGWMWCKGPKKEIGQP